MIFLQQAPPDTSAYMVGGYLVIFGAMLFYLVTLILRNRNLNQDLEILEDLEERD